MIQKVWSDKKSIEVGQNDVAAIILFKKETGNIDIYLTKDKNGRTLKIAGFFVGNYQVEYKDESMEQLDIFEVMKQE